VATLAIFSSSGVNPTLNSIVFGESVLNDAVAIVIFKTVVDLGVSTTVGLDGFAGFDAAAAGKVLGSFFLIFLGSIAIGVLAGFLIALVFKTFQLYRLHDAASAELIVLICFSYAQFIIAEFAGLSGIVATLFCGLTTVIYGAKNMTPQGDKLCRTSVKVVARFTETIIFVLIGTGFWTYVLDTKASSEGGGSPGEEVHCRADVGGVSKLNLHFILLTLSACLLSRVISVFPLAALINCWRSEKKKIRLNSQAVIWFSGLRGAIALALAVEFPQFPLTKNQPGEGNFCYQRDHVVACTIVVVVFTVYLMGGLTQPVLKLCGIEMGEGTSMKDKDWKQRTKSKWKRAVRNFDLLYVRPAFVHDFQPPPSAVDGARETAPTCSAPGYNPGRSRATSRERRSPTASAAAVKEISLSLVTNESRPTQVLS